MKDTRKDRPRIKKIEEMLSPKTSQGLLFHERCRTWRGKWIR